MKVAIIGAGITGLAAGIALEKQGIYPRIFEQNATVGAGISHVILMLQMAYKPVTNGKPLDYLNQLLGMELVPQGIIKTLIIHSKNATAKINEDIGYTFTLGYENESIEQQLRKQIKTQVTYETRIDLEKERGKYDHVIVASGARAQDMIADRYLKGWQTTLVGFTRIAMLEGDFDANSMEVWFNRDVLKEGFAYLTPFSSTRASLVLVMPNLKSWQEFDQHWVNFTEKQQIFRKYHFLSIYQRLHISAKAKSHKWENCTFIGDAGGFIEPFLGLGSLAAISTGYHAAQSIIKKSNYDDLIKPILTEHEHFSSLSKSFNKLNDNALDKLISAGDNELIQKLFYASGIDWLRWGGFATAPVSAIIGQQEVPDFHHMLGTHFTPK